MTTITERIAAATGATDITVQPAPNGDTYVQAWCASLGSRAFEQRLQSAGITPRQLSTLGTLHSFYVDTPTTVDADDALNPEPAEGGDVLSDAVLAAMDDEPMTWEVTLPPCKPEWFGRQIAEDETPRERLLKLLADITPDNPLEHWDIGTQVELSNALYDELNVVSRALHGSDTSIVRTRQHAAVVAERDALQGRYDALVRGLADARAALESYRAKRDSDMKPAALDGKYPLYQFLYGEVVAFRLALALLPTVDAKDAQS